MPDLHLKSCLCQWNPLAQTLSCIPKPVTPLFLFYKSERFSRRPGMPNLHLKSCLGPLAPLALNLSCIPKLVAFPLLFEKNDRSSRSPGMPNLHLKPCLCPWNPLALSFSGIPKPVALPRLSEKMNVLRVAVACPICIRSGGGAHGIPLLKVFMVYPNLKLPLFYLTNKKVFCVAPA